MAADAHAVGIGSPLPCRQKSALLGTSGIGNLLDEFDDGLPHMTILYAPECSDKTERVCGIEEIEHVAAAFLTVDPTHSATKEEQDRHLQDLGYLLQPGRPDAVGSLFVFLHLLECHAECEPQGLLRHAKLTPSQFEALADFTIPKR